MTQREAIDKALKKHETNCCMFERGVQTLDDLLASRTVFLGVLQAAQAQAALSKLAAGVSVEPVAEVQTLYYGSEHPPVAFTGVVLSDKTDYYSLPFRENAQLYTASAIAAARVQAINECADKCDELGDEHTWHISAAIRALIGGAT